MHGSTICPKCNGNGYITIRLQGDKEDIHKDCTYCNNQGEIKINSDKTLKKYMDYTRMQQ